MTARCSLPVLVAEAEARDTAGRSFPHQRTGTDTAHPANTHTGANP